jgi:hypothetical protein
MADKTDYSFKKLVGREYTSNVKQWYEEFPGILRYVHASSVWIDDIAQVPPDETTLTIRVYNTLTLVRDVTVSSYRSWKAEDPPTTRLYGFISPSYGVGYTVRLYDNADREVPTTDGSSWLFDYDNGTLSFDNNPTNYGWNAASFKIKAYLYIGNVLGPAKIWKGQVDDYSHLPLVGNTIGDVRPIADRGDGKWALYRCIATTGPVSNQWQLLEAELLEVDGGNFIR